MRRWRESPLSFKWENERIYARQLWFSKTEPHNFFLKFRPSSSGSLVLRINTRKLEVESFYHPHEDFTYFNISYLLSRLSIELSHFLRTTSAPYQLLLNLKCQAIMWCLVSQPNAIIIEVEVDSKAKGQECLEKVTTYVSKSLLSVPRALVCLEKLRN